MYGLQNAKRVTVNVKKDYWAEVDRRALETQTSRSWVLDQILAGALGVVPVQAKPVTKKVRVTKKTTKK